MCGFLVSVYKYVTKVRLVVKEKKKWAGKEEQMRKTEKCSPRKKPKEKRAGKGRSSEGARRAVLRNFNHPVGSRSLSAAR